MPKFEQDIKLDAPVDKVWSILMNASTWPLWFPDAEQITNLGKVAEGATFQWHGGKDSGTGSIVSIDEDRGMIKVVTGEGGRQTTHTVDLDRRGGLFGVGGNESRISYAMEYDAPGGFLGEFVTGGNPMETLKVKGVLEKIKNLVEK